MNDMRQLILGCGITAVCAAGAHVSSQTFFAEPDVNVLYSLQPGDPSFGFVAEVIGDIDRDGTPDFVVGAQRDMAGGTIAGAVYVYSGRSGALLRKVNGQPFNRFGFSVAAAGDVDLDGIPDYVVGAPGAPVGPAPQIGRVVVLSGATHEVIISASGTHHLDLFGWDVNTAGDVNNDGRPDVVVGARLYSGTFTNQGSLHVISGSNGARLWNLEGDGANTFLGAGVSGVADVTGDGTPDIAAAATGAGPQGRGRAYVFSGVDGALVHTLVPSGRSARLFGQFFVHDAGDVDADGTTDVYVGDYPDSPKNAPGRGRAYVFSGATGERVRTFVGEFAGDGLGGGRGAGDVDGDGHADLVIASWQNDSAAPAGGRIYLFSGRNGKVLRTMTGTVAGLTLGIDVVALGDVSGDGKTDFLITGAGIAHVVTGN